MTRFYMEQVKEGGDGGGTPTPTPSATPTPTPTPSASATPTPTPTPSATPTPTPTPAKTFSWSDGWREHLAGGDEKEAKRLERFGSPSDIFKSYRALEQRVSSGELKQNVAFPDKGTEEEKAAWRKGAGLPEKADGYELKYDDGFVVGEDDKAVVSKFLEAAHSKNMTPAAVKDAVRWFFDEREAQAKAREESDEKFRVDSEEALRGEWGGDYRKNVNLVKGLIGTAPQEIQDQLMFARLADGKPLTSHPEVLKWLTGIARTVNPVAAVVPGGDSASMATSIDDEIKTIETTMRTNRKAYNADEKMQARYRELLDARERLKVQRAA